MIDKKYMISVDGGGTKTKFCVMDIEEKDKKYFVFGSTNYKVIGLEKTEDNLVHAFHMISDKMSMREDNILGIVFGLSGFDTPKDYEIYSTLLEKLNISKKKIYLCNDSELAFYSKGELPGMVIVAGTGSISHGMDQSKSCRVGGWGSPISDLGSGYWIGTEVLKDLLRYCDGYFDFQEVFKAIKDFCGAKTFEVLPFYLSGYHNKEVASIAKLVCEYAEEGDAYCSCLVDIATKHTAEMAKAVYQKMEFNFEKIVDVVLVGSLFKNSFYEESFKKYFLSQIDGKNVRFKKSVLNPVDGGIHLGLKKFCNH